MGLAVVNPKEHDLVSYTVSWTDGVGMDAAFEVSGSSESAGILTGLLRPRGRIIVVAIFSEQQPMNLFHFFWKELRMIGVRVYEPQDYEEAIELIAAQELPLSELITGVRLLKALPEVFSALETNPDYVKILIDCSE
jgi:threonine dehydrogenase-like Zn-dependent dehydrogenase